MLTNVTVAIDIYFMLNMPSVINDLKVLSSDMDQAEIRLFR
jgi:hypothetical protein